MPTNRQLPTRMPRENELPPLCQADLAEARKVFPFLDTGSFGLGWLMRESLAQRQIAALVPDRGTGLQPVSVGGTGLKPVSDRGTGLQPVMGVCDCGKVEHGRHHMRCPALRPAETTCSVCKSNIAVCECGG